MSVLSLYTSTQSLCHKTTIAKLVEVAMLKAGALTDPGSDGAWGRRRGAERKTVDGQSIAQILGDRRAGEVRRRRPTRRSERRVHRRGGGAGDDGSRRPRDVDGQSLPLAGREDAGNGGRLLEGLGVDVRRRTTGHIIFSGDGDGWKHRQQQYPFCYNHTASITSIISL